MKLTFNRPFRLLFMSFLVLGIVAIGASMAKIRINFTPSLPKGIYRIVDGTPAVGDYVTFCLDGDFAALALERGYLQPGVCPSGVQPLLKRLAGLPGDGIERDAFGIRSEDRLGLLIPSVLENSVIPQGMALVLADHPGSFDSRYFGLIPLENLQRVEPVFLFNSTGE